MICPANWVVPPWLSLTPAPFTEVDRVIARVSAPPKLTSLQTKQIRLMPGCGVFCLVMLEVAPEVTVRAVFGAVIHVLNELLITVVTLVVPVIFESVEGLMFHCT